MVEDVTTVEIERNPDPKTMRPSKALKERESPQVEFEDTLITEPVSESKIKLRDMVGTTVNEQIQSAVGKAMESKRPTTIVSKIIPTNNNGQISVEQLFLTDISIPQVGVRRSHSDSDKLLFTFEDVISTRYPIARLMRMVLFQYKVTQAEFDEKHRQYAESQGFLNVQVNYNRNNIKKAMVRDRLSYQMFEIIVLVIMGFGLDDLIFKLIEPETGNIVEFSLTKILEKAQTEYTPPTPVMVKAEDITYVIPDKN